MVDTSDPSRHPRLVGRVEEQSALAGVLARITTARAAVAVVRGLPGQGKTTLLDWLAGQACRDGAAVVRTTGVEFEMGVAYSGLSTVLRPLMGQLGTLPDALSEALSGALGLRAHDSTVLATYSATLALLSAAAEEEPTLVLVDDAHWVDHSSLEALLFAAHRCDADRVGFVFAQRSGMPCLVDQARFPVVELGGLGSAAAIELLSQLDVAPPVARRCWERTDGNPMALIEATRGLSAEQRHGQTPLPAVLPVAEGLLDAFRDQIREMASRDVRALRVAALEGDDDVVAIAAGLDRLGGNIDDLTTAERDGLVVVVDGRVRWRHPLLRAAVSAEMTGRERRAVHRALAEVMTQLGRDDRAVWHLSESVAGPDDAVAGRLADAAAAARRRGALASAADAYAHAARLTARPGDRARYVLASADARFICCDFQGVVAATAPLLNHSDDPIVRARATLVAGQAETWLTGAPRSARRMEASAATVTEHAADVSTLLMLQATIARLLAVDIAGALHTAEIAATTAEHANDPTILFAAYAVRSLVRFFAGRVEAAAALEPIAQVVVGNLDKVDEGVGAIAQLCAFAQIAADDAEAGIALLRLVIDHGDRSGIIGTAALARVVLGEGLWRVGRWSESLAEVSHLWSLQEAMGQVQAIACASAVLARIEAGLGQADACRRHARDALEVTERLGLTQLWLVSWSALGLLALGAAQHSDAAAAFDEIVARDTVPEPGWLWWQADACEAFLGCGRRDSAQDVLDRLEEQATATGRSWARAAVDRCVGLLATGDDADDRFTSALSGFRSLQAPFEEARTLLLRGRRRLDRGSRRHGALDVAEARTIFDRLGARAWSEQASALRGEITADSPSLASQLTPAELRVAMAVGRGASNREAAERLFISVKTVDHHLQSVYRKLGLRRRTQLAGVVAAEASAAS
jgi:DNA-binding CsgD family transcriptional regulator